MSPGMKLQYATLQTVGCFVFLNSVDWSLKSLTVVSSSPNQKFESQHGKENKRRRTVKIVKCCDLPSGVGTRRRDRPFFLISRVCIG